MKCKHNLYAACAAAMLLLPVAASYAGTKSELSKPEAAAAAGKVNLNKADAKALMQVKGINPYKAHAIVSYRKQNGDFKTLDDLNKVKGFKRMKPEARKSIGDQLQLD